MLKLRPHHIIDIIRDFGENKTFSPHPYGHAYHIIADVIVKNLNQTIQLVNCADDICIPCIHLQSNNKCNDILFNHPYSCSKQEYNDYLDKSLLNFLSLEKDIRISIDDYLNLLLQRIEFFDTIYPHSKEIIDKRKVAFLNGLKKLGIGHG